MSLHQRSPGPPRVSPVPSWQVPSSGPAAMPCGLRPLPWWELASLFRDVGTLGVTASLFADLARPTAPSCLGQRGTCVVTVFPGCTAVVPPGW